MNHPKANKATKIALAVENAMHRHCRSTATEINAIGLISKHSDSSAFPRKSLISLDKALIAGVFVTLANQPLPAFSKSIESLNADQPHLATLPAAREMLLTSTIMSEGGPSHTAVAAPQQRREVVVVDGTVVDYQTLIAGIDPNTPIIVLSPEHSGLSGLATALAGYHDLDAVHLVTEGHRGAIQLGTQWVDGSALLKQLPEIQAIANAIKPGGDLLLYGCSVASDEVGQNFVKQLAQLLEHVDVAASTTPTGPALLGGDWDLEFATGEVETQLPFAMAGMQGMSHNLACTVSGMHSCGVYGSYPAILANDGTTKIGLKLGPIDYYSCTDVTHVHLPDLATFNTNYPAQCGSAAPTVTAAKITISGATGAGGVFKIGDTITATWNNTASGDNNSGITGVTVDFSQFGGGAAVVATNSSGTWTATYIIAAGGNSGSNKNVSVTATNGTPTTTTDDANATLDNAVPTLSAVGVSGTTSTDTTLAGTSNETGTGYWIAVANGSTAPTAAQVVAATTYSGVTIVASGNGAMTATVAKSFTVAGLSASTTYTLYLVAKDTAGNYSVVANTNVTTNAPANAAPVASAVAITGTAKVGVQLTGSYTYSDANSDPEGTSTFRWMSDTQISGATKVAISGATASTYTPVAGDQGKYLFFCVTPVATTGTSPGTEVCSSATAAVAPANVTPTFVSAGAGSLTVAQSASATDITGLLHVSDSDSAQTETWTQSVAPSHGTLSFSSATASSGSTDITPGGTITYTPTASYVGNDSFTVQVSDGTASATRVINVTVGSARTVTVNALTLNAMVVNTPFVSQSFSATGGYGAYTYSVSAGSLPAGMSLNTSTGALSGTPTTAGAYNFTIQAADSSTGTGPFSGTRNFTGSIALNGVCGTANGTAIAYQPAAANLCSTGTASAVTAGSPWTWTCAGASGGTTASCSAPNGSTATGSGSGRMEITSSSGGTAWQVQSATFVTTASTGSTPPAGYSFPHGLLDLRLDTGTAGTSATVKITYPSALPANAVYWKYGRTAANTTPHWYQYAGATISGNTVTLTLTDGADGDDDLNATNSLITDPGGPGLPGDPSGVPSLSQWGQLVLSGLLAMVGVGAMRRRRTLNK